MVDAVDSKSSAERRVGSSPTLGTILSNVTKEISTVQGSYRDTVEKFATKSKNSSDRQAHKAQRQLREQRRNRHWED